MRSFFANISVSRYLVLALTLIMLGSAMGCHHHRPSPPSYGHNNNYDRPGKPHKPNKPNKPNKYDKYDKKNHGKPEPHRSQKGGGHRR